MKAEANAFYTWLIVNKLTLNSKKTKFMIFTNKTYSPKQLKKFRLNINKRNIEQITEFRYLGVILDNKLSWKQHISFLQTKLSQASGMFYKNRTFLPLHALKLIYNSLVDSYLRCGIVAWGTAAKYHKDKLQILQNKIVKSMLWPRQKESLGLFYKDLKLLNIEDLFILETAKLMHDIRYGYNPPAFDQLIPIATHTHSTRHRQNAHFDLMRPRTELGKKSIRYTGVKCWTNISHDQKDMLRRKRFTSSLKQHLISQSM